MRKKVGFALGVAIVSALCVWAALEYYVHRPGINEELPPSSRIPSAASPSRNDAESSTTRSSEVRHDHEAHTDDPAMEALLEEASRVRAEETLDMLEAREHGPVTVEEVTIARLKDTALPQTIYGAVEIEEFAAMLEPDDKPLRLYARASGGRTLSASAVIDGKYTLGQLPPGMYMIFLAERTEMPGLVMQVGVGQDQDSQQIDFYCGEAELEVTVLDEAGNKLDSDSVELFLGGTDDEKHMFKRAKSIRDGTWRIKGLLPGQYIASASGGNSSGAVMLNLTAGMNSCVIQMSPAAVAVPDS